MKGNEMYLDAVIKNDNITVVLNSTPEEVKKFVLAKVERREDTGWFHVRDGKTVSRWTAEEYLSR
jgi:hypothetical protein